MIIIFWEMIIIIVTAVETSNLTGAVLLMIGMNIYAKAASATIE
jgi:hypothetical protein